jgi:hypothetical protein
MKTVFQLLKPFLSEFKWYRKKKGGKWFLLYEKSGFKTIDGASQYWTQYLPTGSYELVKEEMYP